MIFKDAAVSGASLARPAFERLMSLVNAKPPKVDAIVVEDISRVSRDFADAAHLFRQLQYLEIPLIGVGDGVDTAARGAKITFAMKSLVSDLYLEDLRDKTLRGLEGRALLGMSTGGLPLGYRSIPETDTYGRVVGHRIEVEANGADVVRRIFRLYLDGRSLEAIARLLNDEHVPPPRAQTRHRRKGWVASTIRAMLHNDAYVGTWRYKRQQWVKVPGTNIRRPRKRDESEVICATYPDRRIVDETTWSETRARLAAVRRCYVRDEGASPARAMSNKQNTWLLSGLLRCGSCGAAMTIHAGTSARYYRCSDAKKRGTCPNRLALREDVARRCILGALAERFRTPAAIRFLRQELVDRLATLSRDATAEVRERTERLQRTEQRIAGLVTFIADGDRSEYVRKALHDLEAQAKTERAAIAGLRATSAKPIVLPSPDEILRRSIALEELLTTDPVRGREALRRLFDAGQLLAHPQPDGTYVAESHIFPMRLVDFDTSSSSEAEPNSKLWSSHGCAGALRTLEHDALPSTRSTIDSTRQARNTC